MLRSLIARLRTTLSPQSRDARLEEAVQEHLAALIESYQQRGLTVEQATLAARREFGPIEPMKESYRDQARFRPIENLWRDVAFALRQFRLNPGFAAMAVVSLALGIGANTALFSFVDAILLTHLPVPEAQRLVLLESQGHAYPFALTYRQIVQLNRETKQLAGLFGRFPIAVSVTAADQPRWVAAELVTGAYFKTLQVTAVRGRVLNELDLANAAGNPVCVVSYRFWRDNLHADPHVVGRPLRINMRAYQVVGVSQQGFSGTDLQEAADVQIPATRLVDFMPSFIGVKNFDWTARLYLFQTFGKLRTGSSRASADGELNALYQQTKRRDTSTRLELADGSGGFGERKTLGKPATILLAISGVVLLIACANLATLLLSRTTARSREFAIRLALGSSRRRVVSQVLTESALIALFGSVAGVIVAIAIQSALLDFLNSTTPEIHQLQIEPDVTVLLFAMAMAAVCVLLFGSAPAVHAAKTAKLGTSSGNTAAGAFTRKAFVAAQIGLSFVVLFAAGLLTRTLSHLETVKLGYHPENLALIDIRPAAGGYSGARASQFYSDAVERVRSVPGIHSVAATFGIGSGVYTIKLDRTADERKSLEANLNGVGPGYFDTMGARILEGRDFNAGDRTPGRSQVYLINQHLAKEYFPGVNPVGRYLMQNGDKLPIVGVVADVHDQEVRNDNANTVYQDVDQLLSSGLTLVARCNGPCEGLLPAIRKALRTLDPNTPILGIHTLRNAIDGSLSSEQILGFLSMLFAALAVLLTAAGLYGILSYSVTRRTREIGLRTALGASVSNVILLLSREVAVVLGIGMCVGVPAAYGAVTMIRSQLFGVGAHDPLTLAIAAGAVLGTAVAGTVMPLRRALRIAPARALRVD